MQKNHKVRYNQITFIHFSDYVANTIQIVEAFHHPGRL